MYEVSAVIVTYKTKNYLRGCLTSIEKGLQKACGENYRVIVVDNASDDGTKEMMASGFIEIQSHFYDMHQSQQYESGIARTTVKQLKNESETNYIAALRNDIRKAFAKMEEGTGNGCYALVYWYTNAIRKICF
jgi:glycosyltransferase involved in cell wall biosynthesis